MIAGILKPRWTRIPDIEGRVEEQSPNIWPVDAANSNTNKTFAKTACYDDRPDRTCHFSIEIETYRLVSI